MTPQQALGILKWFQRWRLGKTDTRPYTPAELTEAIEVVIKEMKTKTKTDEYSNIK